MSAVAIPIEDQNEVMSERDMGFMRWRAIEAANSAPDLSPMARRVLIAMLCMMDGKTRACFPSELRIASFLGTHVVSVKKAKAELRDGHRLIHWTNPNGPRHQSRYIFNWEKLIRLSDEAKSRGDSAVKTRKAGTARQGSQTTTFERESFGSETATNDTGNGGSKVANSHSKVAVSLLQGSQMATPKVAASLPEQPINNGALSTQPHHDEIAPARHGGAGASVAASSPCAKRPAPLSGKEALERKASPAVPSCPYSELVRQLSDAPNVMEKLYRLDAEKQAHASKLLATKGKTVAAAYVAQQA